MLVREQMLGTKKEKRDHTPGEYTHLIQQCRDAAKRAYNPEFKELWEGLATDLERVRLTFYPIGAQVLKGKKK